MKILILDKIQKEAFEIFEENSLEYYERYDLKPNELKKEIENYEAIIVRSRTKITSDILENARILKAIGRAGTGLDNIDLNKAKELNVKIFNTPKAPAVSVAELTIGLMISLVRHIPKANQTMHYGQWRKSDYLGSLLKGKKLGLIGFGTIGQEVAKRAIAFDMEIGIYDLDPSVKEIAKQLGYKVYNTIDNLLQDVQITSLHIPATIDTENTIDERRLKLLNKNSIIINTARGILVDEKALIKALKNREIGGAALDVYREEPLKDSDVFSCEDNLVLTPHIGSQTKEAQIQASIDVAKKISGFLKSLE
ncbi:MAG: D-3-phosphoglycerate dehydrogenase [Candidatus Lokiarchaeum sp. GC14_75]|nr:MAG: D-3-phosphoglycerate dehydrogenase [Candidatus Lokiarchaeum sp. GC14_75]